MSPRWLGLDLGSRTIGVAVSDPLGLTAQPLTILRIGPRHDGLEELAELVKLYEVQGFVLGWPRHLNGSEGDRVTATAVFAAQLAERFGLPVEREDERLTTRMAERAMLEGDLSRSKRKQNVDKLAAALILQSFLDRQRR